MAGKVIFSEIPRLPDQWWTLPPSDIEGNYWAKNTYYLWGANAGNYQITQPGASLNGAGMAGPHGPTRGVGNPFYIGVITTSLSAAENKQVFTFLSNKLTGGSDIVIPIYHGKFSLGTGLAVNWFSSPAEWTASQVLILNHCYQLCRTAASVDVPAGVFWPNCSVTDANGETICASHSLTASSANVFDITDAGSLLKIANAIA